METKFGSPSGKYLFQICAWEARMSHWIETPQLIETESGRSVFEFSNSNWSLENAQWLDAERVKLSLRCYPGDHWPSTFEVLIDCEQKLALSDGNRIGLPELERHLEALYMQAQESCRTERFSPPRVTLLSRWVTAFVRVFKG